MLTMSSLPAVNILLVVGSQKLYVDMSRLMAQNQTVRVVRVPKSDGVSFFISRDVEPELNFVHRASGIRARYLISVQNERSTNQIILLRWTSVDSRNFIAFLYHRQIRRSQNIPSRRRSVLLFPLFIQK